MAKLFQILLYSGLNDNDKNTEVGKVVGQEKVQQHGHITR